MPDTNDGRGHNPREGNRVGMSLGCVKARDIFTAVYALPNETTSDQGGKVSSSDAGKVAVRNLQNGVHVISVVRETNLTLHAHDGLQNHRIFPGLAGPALTVHFTVDREVTTNNGIDGKIKG